MRSCARSGSCSTRRRSGGCRGWWGRHAQARERLTAAAGVLRDDPDADTVQALNELASLEVFAGAPEADALTAEALTLGQDLAADDATLARLFTTRGLWHTTVGALEISHEATQWAWPLAARAAHDLADSIAAAELLALLDRHRPGQLAPMQRAERDLARARLTGADADPGAGAAFTAAITGLRQRSTPYHLAHGLLDHAEHLLRTGDDEAAAAAAGEARGIAVRLGCQPLLDRADTIRPASPPAPAPERPHRPAVESADSALLHTERNHA